MKACSCAAWYSANHSARVDSDTENTRGRSWYQTPAPALSLISAARAGRPGWGGHLLLSGRSGVTAFAGQRSGAGGRHDLVRNVELNGNVVDGGCEFLEFPRRLNSDPGERGDLGVGKKPVPEKARSKGGTFDVYALPAISVTCGFTKGLPIGLQIIGPPGGRCCRSAAVPRLRASYRLAQASSFLRNGQPRSNQRWVKNWLYGKARAPVERIQEATKPVLLVFLGYMSVVTAEVSKCSSVPHAKFLFPLVPSVGWASCGPGF
jgi:hypothetical protein